MWRPLDFSIFYEIILVSSTGNCSHVQNLSAYPWRIILLKRQVLDSESEQKQEAWIEILVLEVFSFSNETEVCKCKLKVPSRIQKLFLPPLKFDFYRTFKCLIAWCAMYTTGTTGIS